MATSPLSTDHRAMRTDDGMGHAGGVASETKVALPSVLIPNVPFAASPRLLMIWLTLGRRQAGEGSVLEFILPQRPPSSCHISAFPLRPFPYDDPWYLEQTIMPLLTPHPPGRPFC